MYKLCFYVPDSHLEAVKKAVFAIGAGRIGAYDSCCWQVLGRAVSSAGRQSALSANRAGATRAGVESGDGGCRRADSRQRQGDEKAHPYETPAFDVWRLSDMQF